MKGLAFKFFSLFVAFSMALGMAGNISQTVKADGTIGIAALGSTYTQNFDSLANTGTNNATTTLPTGWMLTETGGGARDNEQYAADTGGSNTGDTYSYGSAAATDRAFGGLQSGSLIPVIGASFTNNTGGFITSLAISYTGEEWRLGTAGRTDQIDFQLSTDATSLTTGTWVDYNNLDFVTPVTATTGAKDGNLAANRTAISYTISGIGVANGSTFWIRWTDFNASGGDDGLSVDDFSITFTGGTSTNPSGSGAATPTSVAPGGSVLLTLAVTPGTFPTSTGLAATCNLSSIGGSATQTFYNDGTNGDVTSLDNTFSYSTTVTSGTTAGSKSMSCSITDSQARSGSGTIALNIYVILPIGTVNGAVGDAEVAINHRSPYAPASGNGTGSTYVTVQGVIYERTLQAIANSSNTYKGLFIQNTAATRDADPNTSDGLFVFMSTATTIGAYTPTVGDEIVITGRIQEYYNMTELVGTLSVISVVRSGVDILAELPAIYVNPPADLATANRYWERLQSMRVGVPMNSIVLGGRNVFSPADAEIWVAAPDSTVALRADPYTRRAFRDSHPLDDNYDPTIWDGNGYRILMGSLGIKYTAGDGQTLIDPATTFDTLTNGPVGGLNYTFNKYRIEITSQPTFSDGVDPAANNPPVAFDRSLGYSIVDYNLENLYDYRNNPFSGCDFATDTAGCPRVVPFLAAISSPYDYVPANDALYQGRLTDIANQIINNLYNPDIIMVQEIENQDICVVTGGALVCGSVDNADGKPDVLQELALKIASLGGPAYDAAFDRNSSDLRGIAPAYLYRTDRVELLPAAGDPVLGTTPAIIYAGAGVASNADISNPKTLNAVLPAGVSACETSWVMPRAVSVGLFRIYRISIGVGGYTDVYTLNNHFKSGPDTCVAHRTEQARYNAAVVQFINTVNPGVRVVVAGDFNVYPRPDDIALGATDQLGSLYDTSLGLKNLWEVALAQHPESAYSYVYLGMAQTLDQMFVNQSLLSDLVQFAISHINSDFPADYTSDSARGTSDHDPSFALFQFGLGPTASLINPLDASIVNDPIHQLTVQFNKDVLHNAGLNAADNPMNYMLVEAGSNRIFDTLSCGPVETGGPKPDDVTYVVDSITYDPITFKAVLTVNGSNSLPEGNYRLFVCGTNVTGSIHDLVGNVLNNGLLDSTGNFRVYFPDAMTTLPSTGFAPDRVTELPAQTVNYAALGDLWLEIPSLNIKTSIVGVPQTGNTWDVTWLGSQAGWLEGSVFPTALGNSVLTAHVWDALNKPGAFFALNKLQYGNTVIVHSYGKAYVYEVRGVLQVSPTNVNAMLKQQDDAWLTLVTCQGYSEATDEYQYRTLVRAVLVDVR